MLCGGVTAKVGLRKPDVLTIFTQGLRSCTTIENLVPFIEPDWSMMVNVDDREQHTDVHMRNIDQSE